MIIKSACAGNWLLLDNLQLSIEIIPNLQKFIETMYEAHAESKEKLTEQCRKEFEAELMKKVEKGISTNEDEMLL